MGQLQLELGLPSYGVDLLILGILGYSLAGAFNPATYSEENQRDVKKRNPGEQFSHSAMNHNTALSPMPVPAAHAAMASERRHLSGTLQACLYQHPVLTVLETTLSCSGVLLQGSRSHAACCLVLPLRRFSAAVWSVSGAKQLRMSWCDVRCNMQAHRTRETFTPTSPG